MPDLLIVPQPLLAFGFASPLLLWGLALGSVPVIIHLLHKRRYREMPWAAMRFLIAASRKNSRRIRLEQLLLLAVRVLILLLLALALAQPYVESFGTYFRADVPAHRVIVVDASYSMRHAPAEQSRFEQAMEIARRIVEQGRQGDSYQLLRVAGSEPRAVISEPAFQSRQVARELDHLQASFERGDVAATLRELKSLLARAPGSPNREVYFLSDFQRSNWLPETGGESTSIRQLLTEMAGTSDVTLIDLGQPDSANVAVTSLSTPEPLITTERPTSIQATVRNFGDARLAEQRIELHVDGRLVDVQTVDLPPEGQARVDFSYTFPASGDHQIQVRLDEDALPVDDRRWLVLPVKDELNVLLINGRPAGTPEDNATWFLERALAPTDDRGRGLIRPRVINEGELAGVDLGQYQCVFLANVARFTEREAAILRSYAEAGGVVVVSLGDQVRAENYNQILYRDGKGLLPARLGNRVGNARDPQTTYEFDTSDLSHPIVAPFRGNLGTGLETDFTLEYFETVLPAETQARVALRFTSGHPAIIDAPLGRGRVMLVTTSVDNRWGPWSIQRSFLPVIHEMVRHGLAGHWGERQRLVGEPILRGLPARSRLEAAVDRPDGTTEASTVTEVDGTAQLSYEATTLPGIYELEIRSPPARSELFAINVDVRESDLAKVDESEWREAFAGADFQYRTDWEGEQRAVEPAVAQRGGLTRWLLLAVFCLLLVEVAMAWNFLVGAVALYAVIAMAFVTQGWTWQPLAGVVLALVFGAGLVAIVLATRRQLLPPRSPP